MCQRGFSRLLVVILLLVVMVPIASGSTALKKSQVVTYYAPSLTLPLPAPPITQSTTHLAPITGTLRVLVIAAQFSDINATVSIDQIKQEWAQANQYYQEASFGKVSLQVDVFGWYKLPYPELSYGGDCLAIDDPDCSGQDLAWHIAQDAATLAQGTVNFNNYDYYAFVHSGYGQESSGNKNDVWSVTFLGGAWVKTQTKSLNQFSIDPELEARGASPVGVYTHEFAHQLGVPDLYNTQTGDSIMGPWTLMDSGLWNGNPAGSSPAHLDSWSKIQLGWISGSTLALATSGVMSNYTIDPTEIVSNNIHAVQVPTSTASRYYLVEVRQHIGFDAGLPSVGVLILYVDQTMQTGEVQVMNANPGTSGLRGATWAVGQIFSNVQNNVTIAITGQVGNSYKITVNPSGEIQPPPPPNQTYVQLSITSVFARPNVITLPNTTVTIFIDVANSGTQSASSVPIEIDLDGQQYAARQVSVSAGSTVETSFTWTSTVGSHTFRIVLDPSNTLNQPSRAGNVAIFTLYVGPTLTINVPANMTSNGGVWVKINGVQYNLNSSQFQTSVANGTITVQIEPAVNTSVGVRQAFTGWSDGNTANPRQVVITGNTQLTARFGTQYLLSVNANQGTTSPGGWYNAHTLAAISANAISNLVANTTRLSFESWSGDYSSTSTSISINMTKPLTIQANWMRQYYVIVLTSAGSPSGAGWYNSGTNASISIQPIVEFANGTRDVFTGWNVTTTAQSPAFQFRVDSPKRLWAIWKVQYLIQLASSYGSPSGSGWYDAGSAAKVSIQPQVDYNNGTRRVFTGWTGDYSGSDTSFTLSANKPKSASAQWKTQYQITFKVTGLPNSTMVTIVADNASHPVAVNQPYSAWYDQGQVLDPTANQTVMTYFQFASWRNSTGGSVPPPATVSAPGQYTAEYSPALPLGIPGFPIESVMIGIAAGLLMIVLKGRRQEEKGR